MTEAKKRQGKKPKPAGTAAPSAKKSAAYADEAFRGIVRIAGKDIAGEVPLARALFRVRGIGHSLGAALATSIHRNLGFDPSIPVGNLTEADVEKIDAFLSNSDGYQIPTHLFNRRIDVLDGTSRHLIMNDLIFAWKQDIEREKKLYTWRGYRHAYGQKVRGQRTRNTGRTGLAVGVMRKAVLAAQKGAEAAEAAKKGGPAAAPAAATAAAPAAPAAKKPAEKPAAKG